MRLKTNLLKRFNVICPVQSFQRKYSCFQIPQISPGIPYALCFQGEDFMHDSGASRRGVVKPYP
jgi:hypothetical protein